MHARAGIAGQLQDGGQGDGFGGHWDAVAGPGGCDFAVVGHAVARQEGVLRLQPDGVSRRWPHTAWRAAIPGCRRWRDWPGRRRRQPASASSAISVSRSPLSQLDGQRTDRIDVGELGQALGAVRQHLDQAGFVERRVGVGRAGQAGDAAGGGGGHFGFERGAIFVAGLAQAGREVDQAGADDAVARVDRRLRPQIRPGPGRRRRCGRRRRTGQLAGRCGWPGR
jgi:hypothetical protein